MKPATPTLPQGLRPLTPQQSQKTVGGTTLSVGPKNVAVKVTFLRPQD